MKDVPSYYGFWAKTPSRGSDTYHLLPYHLVETGAVLETIWDKSLPAAFKESVADSLGVDVGTAGRLLPFIASLHDIGKATPAFQSRDATFKDNLKAAGFSFRGGYTYNRRHDLLTCAVLPDLFAKLGFEKRVAGRFALILGGHHGEFPALRFKISGREIGGEEWGLARDELMTDLYKVFDEPSTDVSYFDNSTAVKMSGLFAVSDWLASNEAYFPYQDTVMDLTEYREDAKRKASSALEILKWSRPENRDAPFYALFPKIEEMRPLQETVVSMSEGINGQCLVLIEAPTGEGKTEAAMYIASHLSGLGQQGCYFALPTQATSDQMFGRAKEFLDAKFDSDLPNLILLHGHANLSSEMEVLNNDKNRVFSVSGMEDSVAINEWFTHTKRGLLSLYGVGTIDQILMAAIRTRHVCVRLFGLANKVVIVDEVHAYDVYMTTLLKRLIRWLAKLGCSVILLSATLPESQSSGLVDAFISETGFPMVVERESYPRVTVVTEESSWSESFATSAVSSKEVRLRWWGKLEGDNIRLLGEELVERLKDGGCAAIICNSVARAQEVYMTLKPFLGDEIDLFHARFPYRNRKECEDRNIERFKKDGTRPHRFVLVATQVVEQSLDLDFDLMVTELAPIDLIIQRIGRLWRHDIKRPSSTDSPVCYICEPDKSSFDYGVYDSHVLLKSWLVLKRVESIRVPNDIERLVETVYGNFGKVPDEMLDAWEITLARREKKLALDESEAEKRHVPLPSDDGNDSLRRITEDVRKEDAPDFPFELQALTRLMSPNVSVICLYGSNGKTYLDREMTVPVDLNKAPSMEMTKELLNNSLNISVNKGWYRTFMEVDRPEKWKTPFLRNYYPLVFKGGCAQVGPYRLLLDEETGLKKETIQHGV